MFVPSENQALVGFYNEIVATLLKCYMLIQMTHMVQTVNNLGKDNILAFDYSNYKFSNIIYL